MTDTKKYKRFNLKILLFLPLVTAGWLVLATPTMSAAADSINCPPNSVLLKDKTCCPKDQATSDGRSCCPKGTADNKNHCLFAKYVNPLISLLSVAVGLVVVIGVIVGGIQYATSGGDPQKASSGKNHIQNALLGLLAYLLLFTFLQFIIPGGLF